MSGINAQSIKELRERTQAGMSDCKSALVEAEGDMEKAVAVILKKGLAKSAKRAGAVASEGEVRASVAADKRSATVVEVNIQTDFAARNDAFKNFVGQVLEVAERSTHGADLHTQVVPGHGKTVGDVAVELTGKIGEKIQVRRWARVEVPEGKPGVAHAYVHLGGKIGVVLAIETDTAAVAAHADVLKFVDDTAMQIAAMNAQVLTRKDVAEDHVAKQKEIFAGQLKEDPKTAAKEAQWPKMIEGKLNKWYTEIALLEQESVVTPGQSIDKLREAAAKAAGGAVAITRFVRFERGEGIEKAKDDFAADSIVAHAVEPLLVRSAQSGPWSAAATWAGGQVPPVGASVQIRPGHAVTYDLNSAQPIRAIFVAGTLRFAPDRDTRLDVGLIKIQPGDDTSEDGFNCDGHGLEMDHSSPKPALEVGTANEPVEAKHTALIRLVYFDGMDPQSCPAIVCCDGRMEYHGAELNHTWVKLGATVKPGSTVVSMAEAVTGWRVGDRVFLTATTRQNKRAQTFRTSVRDNTQTEERVIREVTGTTLTLDQPLAFEHLGDGAYRGEVANLSRNVIVESADPAKARGHTMYHRGSSGAISYAEFRHLGKEGVLGRYSIHFHLARATMRGASVVGASIWDSGNRWITIHGTDYLVVRDCVGYQSIGHGFFLEDGTEVYNVFDHNLAVQACVGKPLPKQVLPFDHNDGAGFWWANSLNTFTRNVAAECDEYGFRFDAAANSGFDLALNVPQPDGSRRSTDIRTLPFVRFDDNEIHCQRRHSLNLGGLSAQLKGDVGGVGPDAQHPFIIRNLKVWDVHWAFHPRPPSVMVDGLDVHHAEYALWKANYVQHAYRRVTLDDIAVNPNFDPIGTQPTEREFPGKLKPVDDLPPITVITATLRQKDGSLLVRGTTSDNGEVKRVVVNGREARATAMNFSEWEVTFDKRTAVTKLAAHAEDAAGNIEPKPHVLALVMK